MSEDNKVVQFPSHKIKKSQKETIVNPEPPVAKSQRGSLLISLFATVMIATILTSHLNQGSKDEASLAEGRDLASAEVHRDLEEDLLLARKIARQSLREPASRGREPSAEDILRHGELAGLYRLSFGEGGALTGLDYASQPGNERFIEDRAQFLVRNADLIRVDFKNPELTKTIPSGDKVLEVFELKSKSGEVKARVHFEVSKQHRFYSMKVENI